MCPHLCVSSLNHVFVYVPHLRQPRKMSPRLNLRAARCCVAGRGLSTEGCAYRGHRDTGVPIGAYPILHPARVAINSRPLLGEETPTEIRWNSLLLRFTVRRTVVNTVSRQSQSAGQSVSRDILAGRSDTRSVRSRGTRGVPDWLAWLPAR